SVQAQRVPLVLNAGGIGTWTYPNAYTTGAVPVVETTAESPSGASYAYDAKVVAGTVTNTSCQIMVNKISNSVTLPGIATSLLGYVINILTPATGTVVVHCWARTPS
ncbi:hypothetical protein G3W55_25455, partial [Escherichia coli]|nr:hypothetical protein [Escherichia coli]